MNARFNLVTYIVQTARRHIEAGYEHWKCDTIFTRTCVLRIIRSDSSNHSCCISSTMAANVVQLTFSVHYY